MLHLPSLRSLNITNNVITDVQDFSFTPLKMLMELGLSKNRITKLTSKGLGNLPNIKVLILSGNQFLRIVMHHLNFPLVEKIITESYMVCCLFKASRTKRINM